jgi:hypothetical protein
VREGLTMKATEELKQLALDIADGKVFGSWMTKQDEVSLCFVPLNMLSNEQRQEMIDKEITVIYEYLDKACQRGINGLPMFLSFHQLTRHEAEALQPMIDTLRKQREEFLNG